MNKQVSAHPCCLMPELSQELVSLPTASSSSSRPHHTLQPDWLLNYCCVNTPWTTEHHPLRVLAGCFSSLSHPRVHLLLYRAGCFLWLSQGSPLSLPRSLPLALLPPFPALASPPKSSSSRWASDELSQSIKCTHPTKTTQQQQQPQNNSWEWGEPKVHSF